VLVLGLTTEGDSGAAVVADGRILAAINEERLARMKLVSGFPRAALRSVLDLAGVTIDQLDAVIIASERTGLVDQLEPFDGWFQGMSNGNGRLKRVASRLAPYRDALPFLETGYYALMAPKFAHRRRALRRILHDEFGVRCPVRFVGHHFAHLTSAYYTSGFRDALVASVDGGGDGQSSLIYAVRDGKWEYLHEASAYNSLGNYYAYITHICGFKAQKHEGKITGLAAYGEPKYVNLLKEFIDEENGNLVNRGRVAFFSAIEALEARLPKGWTREDLAASIQRHFEDVTTRYLGHWVRKSGLTNLALAGGVFANVRVNEEVLGIPGVERVFIHPHMADGGLGGGAALAACVPGVLARTMTPSAEPLTDVYLGPDLSTPEIDAALQRAGLAPEPLSGPLEETVADLLTQGYVVARASGRMEYGPRALGHRSILYQPTDRSVNDWLNVNLKRTEFMPFAPSVLHEERDRCFNGLAGAEHTAEFMTITFHCTPWMNERMHGVVHLDHTARPHLVRRDREPGYHRIIDAFRKRTGLPAVINTSFNMHEEPIVCDADDCVRGFLDGNLDYLAIGPHLVRHPKGLSHSLRPAIPA
jgi:carbamoyltransferase